MPLVEKGNNLQKGEKLSLIQTAKEAKKSEKLATLLKKALTVLEASEVINPRNPSVYHPIITREDVNIPGFSKVHIDVKSSPSYSNYAWFEGSEKIKNAYIACGIIIRGTGQLALTTCTPNDCTIPKGTLLGKCRVIPSSMLPELDLYLQEYPEVVAQERLKRQLSEINSPGKHVLCNTSTKEEEKLPSEISLEEFRQKISQTPKILRESLLPFERLFKKENPGDPFEYMDTPATRLAIRSNAPDVLRPQYARSFSDEEMTFLTSWVSLNEKSGMIRRSTSTISSPLLMVKKPKGGFRVVIDVRRVNKMCIEPSSSIIPDILTPFRRLGHKKVFTTIDISNAFHRQKLVNEHKRYTAFTVPGGPKQGIYEFNSLAQGLNSSPGIFNQIIHDILKDLPPDICYQYVDDILIASDDIEQHKYHLNLVLSRLLSHNLKLDITKSFFGQGKIEYLGLEISNGNVRTLPDRTKSLDRLEIPKLGKVETKKWQQLLGLTGYYRRFIEHYAEKEAKLKAIRDSCLNKTLNGSDLTSERAKATEILQGMISAIKSNILACPKPNSDLLILTDASSYGSGYVLMTSDKRPILFGSGLWNKYEKEMTIFEKELTSVLRAIRKCQPYFAFCKNCKVFCDNIASIVNLNTLEPISVSPKAIKMVLEIQTRIKGSKVEFSHINGLKNVVADSLSRLTTPSLNKITVSDKRVTRQDTKLWEFLSLVHKQNHIGIPRMVMIAKENGFSNTPKIKEFSGKIVDDCVLCNTEKKILSNRVIGHTVTPDRELLEIHIDHAYMNHPNSGHSYIFTAKDPFSKFIWAIPTKSLSMTEVKPILSVILDGYPSIKTVRGDLAFNCTTIKDLCEERNVTFSPNASFNSRQNTVERVHSTLRELIKKYTSEGDKDPENWESKLSKAVKSVNTSPNSTTELSPYSLVFKENFDLGADNNKRCKNESFEKIRKVVFRRIEKSKSKYSAEDNFPKVQVGETLKVRYNSKSRPFLVEVIEDQPLCIQARRLDKKGRFDNIRIAKRHLYRFNINLNIETPVI